MQGNEKILFLEQIFFYTDNKKNQEAARAKKTTVLDFLRSFQENTGAQPLEGNCISILSRNKNENFVFRKNNSKSHSSIS